MPIFPTIFIEIREIINYSEIPFLDFNNLLYLETHFPRNAFSVKRE